ncbi:winged helix-turn-helix domain-containing protein (plasmid) [Vibrio coralliilyticus]|uniref:winged helix-turn-helix domain-containing protein n=1 Tax=Vibrio coralliilyticus TaxID=190893 RepID=UPI000697EB12|nr:winged helix-turn-helix domain-containing protein [Vibrio coralliilyticus]QOU33192.1 winged helix-turn-helix domain-containing protein [Vibrio coralliilyticus]
MSCFRSSLDNLMCIHSNVQWTLDPLAREQLSHVGTKQRKRLKGPECRVLKTLLEHEGKIVDKPHLLSEAWRGRVVSEASITQSISQLRIALGDNGKQQNIIKTMPNEGYMLIENAVRLVQKEEKNHKALRTNRKKTRFGLGIKPVLTWLSSSIERWPWAMPLLSWSLAPVIAWYCMAIGDRVYVATTVKHDEFIEDIVHHVPITYLNTDTSRRFFTFLTQTAWSPNQMPISSLFISNSVKNYHVSCIYTHSSSQAMQAYNLRFSLDENFYFMKDVIHEMCQ